MTVGNLNPVVSWVLEWGQRAKVVEPEELVERVRAELVAALGKYTDMNHEGAKVKKASRKASA
jgi:predicted DNA-binding transcriptional regulator YafY